MKRVILIGLLAGVVMLVVGFAIGQLFYLIDPSIKDIYEDGSIFRSMDDPLMMLFPIYNLVLGFVLVGIWQKTKSVIKAKTDCKRGLIFGLVFALLFLPNLIINLTSFPIPILMPISWYLSMSVQVIVAGLIFSKLLK